MNNYECIKICISIQYICIYKGICMYIYKGMNKYPIYVYICICIYILVYVYIHLYV